MSIRAILLTNAGEATLTTVEEAQLPAGDVLVDVAASTLNYKDAAAITGKAPIIRQYPMVPGIDFAGIVAESGHAGLKPGDAVVLTGWGVGESRWGGLATRARVPGDWLVKLPAAFTPQQAMAIGTAGFTAMLCLLRLEQLGVTPAQGPVLVTGAAGGVGSVAVALLAKHGFEVAALTGRTAERPYLERLGAREIVDRADYAGPAKPLAKERWGAGIDAVGGHVLANLLAATKRDGVVAACGLAGGMELPGSVAPFILRGVTLAGVDSVVAPMPLRRQAWDRLAADLDPALLAAMTTTIGLDEVIAIAPSILAGQVRGRLVVDVTK